MEESSIKDEKSFSVETRIHSVIHAGRGVRLFLRTTHNAWIHVGIFIIVVGLGFYFDITKIEWTMLIMVSGLVFVAEAINTAIEIDINLTSPEYHPYAKDTKDVSAGAVLIASITALIVGLVIFIPYMFE